MNTNPRLSMRGPNATTPAKLPGLQSIRVTDPQTQKALEALREWVEVRLGARGDKYERALTLREFEQKLEPITKRLAEFGDFNGDLLTLMTRKQSSLPALRQGAFTQLGDDLLYCNGKVWAKVTLTPP